jgi:hypothetical protein
VNFSSFLTVKNEFVGTFVQYFGVKNQKCIPWIVKFEFLRVPAIQRRRSNLKVHRFIFSESVSNWPRDVRVASNDPESIDIYVVYPCMSDVMSHLIIEW